MNTVSKVEEVEVRQEVKQKIEDFIEHMFITSNHNYLLLFTELGKCYWLRVFEIPEAAKTSLGHCHSKSCKPSKRG